jgi:glycosyltransferase involved in cell wall biosynthesis
MSPKKQRTVVLTSTDNFVWSSMQEIIPSIERAWRESGKSRNHQVRIVDVGVEPLADYMSDMMAADDIVFTCFTVKLARLGEFLRREAGLGGRYIVYLHNQATIACWPYFAWGFGEVLQKRDVFISSSTLDAKTLRLTFPEGDVRIHPFPLPENSIPGLLKTTRKATHFIYSGRVSSQKNIHTLLYAFRIYLNRFPYSGARLILYGGEDGLGSPNMGFRDNDYGNQMRSLADALEIEKSVDFKGQLDRKKLHRELRQPHVLVSASLHSDENFGMSALRSLCMGAPAVLSRWGGHVDFVQEFRNQTYLVEVFETNKGPRIDPAKFARAMAAAARPPKRRRSPKIPRRYLQKSAAGVIATLVGEKRSEHLKHVSLAQLARPLAPSALAKKILRQRTKFLKKSASGTQIFKSYSDPLSHIFFRAYGMRASGGSR